MLRLDEGIIPRIAHQGLTAAEREDLVAEAKACSTGREGLLRFHEKLQPAHEARRVDQRFHCCEIKEKTTANFGMLRVGRRAADESGEHQIIALCNFRRPIVHFSVAIPVKAGKDASHLVILFPCGRQGEVAPRCFFEFRLHFRIFKNIGAILQIMTVPIHRVLDHLAIPRCNAFEAFGDVGHTA